MPFNSEFLAKTEQLNYCQTIASDHAAILGAGRKDLLKQDLIWVLTRTSAKINRLPCYGETISITTLPLRPGRAEAIRDYYIEDGEGERIILVSSMWCVIDLKKRLIRRCQNIYSQDVSLFMPDVIFDDANQKLSMLQCESQNFNHSGAVRYADIDENMHMNNAKYGDIIVNCLDINDMRQLKRFDINFISELPYKAKYDVYCIDKNNITAIEAVAAGKSAFRAMLIWH